MPSNTKVAGFSCGLVPGSGGTEPMNLGSPQTTSPPLSHGQYLPGFLMGENTNSLATGSQFATPRATQLSPSFTSLDVSGVKQVQFPVHPQSNASNQQYERSGRRCASPPTQSLWSGGQGTPSSRMAPTSDLWELNGPPGVRHSTPSGSIMNPASGVRFAPNAFLSPSPPPSTPTPGVAHTPSGVVRPLTGLISPVPMNSPNGLLTPDRLADMMSVRKSSNPEHASAECWVTIFGYPTSKASFILNQFAQFGTIEKHVITNDGNWMHIKYQNKLQARCAISKNGRVFGDNIMVGVTPCADQELMKQCAAGKQTTDFAGEKENSYLSFASPNVNPQLKSSGTPLREFPEPRLNGLRNTSLLSQSFAPPVERPGNTGISRHSSMRALAGDWRSGQLARSSSIRQDKESGLLSKALGYMFGWS
ncbi:unnamed protein product [Calicophoron daubneyi]|uniref:Nucleoporin NUP35 n=1 Tax=Calicophoron daubneyi TaxID=300641 RepID=A0AAV2TL82_CALDB